MGSRRAVILFGRFLLIGCLASLVYAQNVSNPQDCSFFENLYDNSNVAIPWTRGSCCGYERYEIDPFNLAKTFRGVLCNPSGRITRGSVAFVGLSGAVPPLTNLTSLEVIDFTGNDFVGPFPSVVGLTNLTQIYSRANRFTTFPEGVEDLRGLQYLHIFYNNITGPLPNLSRTAMFDLWVYENRLYGPIDGLIPNSTIICRLTFNNTNTGLYTLTDNFPPSCISENQVIQNLNRAPTQTKEAASTATPVSSPGPNVAAIGGGAVAGVLAVITVIGLFFFFRTRRRKNLERKSPEQKEPHWFFLRIAGPQGLEDASGIDYSGPLFTVVQKYDAQAVDEMDLVPEQVVQVQTIFRDGWAACWDSATGKFGTAPLDCLLLSDHILPQAEVMSFPLARGEGSFVRDASLPASFFQNTNTTKLTNSATANPFPSSSAGSPSGTVFSPRSARASSTNTTAAGGSLGALSSLGSSIALTSPSVMVGRRRSASRTPGGEQNVEVESASPVSYSGRNTNSGTAADYVVELNDIQRRLGT